LAERAQAAAEIADDMLQPAGLSGAGQFDTGGIATVTALHGERQLAGKRLDLAAASANRRPLAAVNAAMILFLTSPAVAATGNEPRVPQNLIFMRITPERRTPRCQNRE
jgi:hypothetical protein